MFKCHIDGQEFETEHALHNYVSRRLKVKLEDYYQKYEPRHDLLTGDIIEFKNKEFYSHTLFNTRENLVKYLKTSPHESVISESIELRKKAKNLRYAPSTVEARTSILPTPLLVKKLGFDYNEICLNVGLDTRYEYDVVLETDDRPLSVLIDTREQKPLKLNADVTVSKLDFGDYTSSSHYKSVFIERKSLIDLCGTLSQGFERFQKELSRASAMDAYIVVCVEENLNNLATVGKTHQTSHVKASPDFLGVRIRALCQQFTNVQFLFVDGRVQMTEIVEKILRLNNDVKALDLQYLYDAKLL